MAWRDASAFLGVCVEKWYYWLTEESFLWGVKMFMEFVGAGKTCETAVADCAAFKPTASIS